MCLFLLNLWGSGVKIASQTMTEIHETQYLGTPYALIYPAPTGSLHLFWCRLNVGPLIRSLITYGVIKDG